jgi:hypothetical protein
MDFRISGLPVEPFQPLFGLSDAELLKQGARRYVADEKPGFPCRVSLADAEPGEKLLLVNYEHQPEPASPYRAKGPIFVREGLRDRFEGINVVPEQLRLRMLSIRAYDLDGLMVDADVIDGKELETLIERFFGRPDTAYIHAHYAKRGCYACRIDRE